MKEIKDYSKFRNITGNRKINQAHVTRLVSAIEQKNLLRYYPILVNEHWEVIDGQHRLAAAAQLDYPVFVEEVDGLRIEDVMSINTNSRSWNLRDFCEAYIQLDKKDYQKLVDFADKHGVSIIGAHLLGGYRAISGGGSFSRVIRAGKFQILTPELAEKVISWVHAINPFTEFAATQDREFISALVKLAYNQEFDFDRLLAKLRMSGQKVLKKSNTKYYLLEIEDIYNFNAKQFIDLYASSQVTR